MPFLLVFHVQRTYNVRMKTKMDRRVEFRADPDAWSQFTEACEAARVDPSAIIRDLCAAAIPYMAQHCPRGRWIAPSLVPFGACDKAAEVVQVHNGKGHQRASVKRKG
jgi:hypothetical protein